MHFPEDHYPELEVLQEDECFRLLGTRHLGRIALNMGALPVVFPIHYALLGQDPVFRTDEGTKLTAASSGSVVCLQVDDADADYHTGWSVMVTGPAEVIADAGLLAQTNSLPLHPWVGRGDAYVRIHAVVVSGRRIMGTHHE